MREKEMSEEREEEKEREERKRERERSRKVWQWHQRMEHLSLSDMLFLPNYTMGVDITRVEIKSVLRKGEVCPTCERMRGPVDF